MLIRKAKDGDVLNVGLVGCGLVVEGLHLPALMSIPGVTVKWACDSSIERARRVAHDWGVRHSYRRISDCSDVDAVLVATPVGTRKGILEHTAERRWHALCEKPFATDTKEHRDFLASAAQYGLILGAGYMRRYYWSVERARKMIGSNALGPLIEVVASESGNLERTGLDQSSYRNNARASGGGVLVETGCHLLNEILFVSNAEKVDIEACVQEVWNDYEVETVASGSLTLPSGEKVGLHCTVTGVTPVFQGIAFRCEFGEIHLSLDPANSLEVFFGHDQRHPIELTHPHPTQNHVLAAFRREWLHFLAALQGVGNWDAQRETGLLTTDAIMQCRDLAKGCSLMVEG